MIELYFDGSCPESMLKGKKAEMRLNEDDFWESEATGLQIAVFPPYAVILPWRGNGKFKSEEGVASNSISGMILTGACEEEGMQIFPDEDNILSDKNRLEWYLAEVYASKEKFDADKFDPTDTKLKEQDAYLATVTETEWAALFNLYDKIEIDHEGVPKNYSVFSMLHEKLYDLKLVFDFNWMSWKKGQRDIENLNVNYDSCSLLELSMYLTTVFRLDRFCEGTINTCFYNGTIPRIFTALKKLT